MLFWKKEPTLSFIKIKWNKPTLTESWENPTEYLLPAQLKPDYAHAHSTRRMRSSLSEICKCLCKFLKANSACPARLRLFGLFAP